MVASEKRTASVWLAVAGLVCAVLATVIPLFVLAAIPIGIVLIVRHRVAIGILAIVLSVVLPTLLYLVVLHAYRTPSESMEPTLHVGDRILINKLSFKVGDPQVGQIVVFHPPEGAVNPLAGQACGVAVSPGQLCPTPTAQEATDINFVKRIVAGPGDTLAIQDGHVIRNGKLQTESFIRPCGGGDGCTFTTPIRIPAGYWFVLGDNRGQSDDSRFWGPVPKSWMIGRVVVRYWPLGRFTFY